MNDLRKNIHVEFKKKMADILMQFIIDLDIKELSDDPEKYIYAWVNATFLPMGDFDKEDALRQIESWSE